MRRASTRWKFKLGACLFAFTALALTTALAGRADDEKDAKKPDTKKAEAKKGDDKGAKKADGDDEALKAELLKFNRAAGEEAQRTRLVNFVKDKDKARAAVKYAHKLQKAAKGDEKPFNFNGVMVLGKAAHFLKEYDVAEYFYEAGTASATKLESGEKMIQAYDGLIDLYWDQKRFQDVIDVCERFVELKGSEDVDRAKPFVLERLVQAKARQGNTDEALRITEGLSQLDDGGWYFVQLKGWVQREAGKFDEAIETYQEVLKKLEASKRVPKDQKDRLKDRVQYTLSGLFVDNNEVEKAAGELQGLIKKHPDNPTYKNDLGFIWADRGQKLDESEKLIREALDLDKKRQEKLHEEGKIDEVKENAAYLDSLGWVLFKQKKAKEALPYLKKASLDEEEGNHLEIWDHLGDVYKALGQTKEATDAWQKGLTMEDVSKRDVDRRKKVIAKMKEAGVEPNVKEPAKKTPPKKKKVD